MPILFVYLLTDLDGLLNKPDAIESRVIYMWAVFDEKFVFTLLNLCAGTAAICLVFVFYCR